MKFCIMDILKDLDPKQQEAVRQTDGPVLILAGAGSGKTRVLTYKVAYLIARGTRPENILAVTFTNKAANEMKERIYRLLVHGSPRFANLPAGKAGASQGEQFRGKTRNREPTTFHRDFSCFLRQSFKSGWQVYWNSLWLFDL